MNWLFISGGQSIGASALTSVLPMNIQCWFPLRLTSLISLLCKGLWSLLQHHSSKALILWHSAFFYPQLSHLCMTTGKAIALIIWTLVRKVMSLLFNMLSRLIIAFLPRSKCLLISWLKLISSLQWFWSPKIKGCHCFHFPPIICHEVMGPDAMILLVWMLSVKPTFSLSSFTFIKRLFSSSFTFCD